MGKSKTELEERTKRFALDAMRFVAGLPRGRVPDSLGYQLLKSTTSIGANYREAQRGESKADFIHKVAIAEKEASETCFWLELCREGKVGCESESAALLKEAEQLLAILATICKRAKGSQALS
ncbi:MAG: four helix bundle protein [Acidobacteriota bacterium]